MYKKNIPSLRSSFFYSGLAAVVLSALLLVSQPATAQASTLEVTLGELDEAIDQIDGNPDAIERLVLRRVEEALIDAGLQFDQGQLLFTDTSENLIDDDSCNSTEIRTLTSSVALDSDTRLRLSLDSINEPIELGLDIAATLNAQGRARQTFGFRLFGNCQKLGEDNFSFSVTGQVQFSLNLRIELNPVLDRSLERLVMRPVITLEGSLQSQNIRADVDDSLLRSLLEDLIEDEVDDALRESRVSEALRNLEADLREDLTSRLEDGVLVVELPEPTDEQISRLYDLLSPQGDFSLSLGLLRERRLELIAALVTGDDEALQSLFSTAAQCEAAGFLQTSLSVTPVYQLATGSCEVLVDAQIPEALSSSTQLYTDNQCQIAFDSTSTSEVDFCNYVLDIESLGNAAARTDTLDKWTLSPGTRFDIGALPLAGKQQPFTQRVAYRQVSTPQGECSLEMRIHALNPESNNTGTTLLKPLIAFHGGSWQRRSSGALGIESFATQFANAGYVVFAPFYRLIGTTEGSIECNDASLDDVLEDASAALDWVQANAMRFGASGKPVVFGQSAGGHISAVLAVERAEDIASAVLFYAPTDFTDFANALLSGEVDSGTGQRILETVVGQSLETLDLNSAIILRNTLTTRLTDAGIDTPPFFLLQGLQDTVLPFEQSVRFCDALSGNPDSGPASLAVAQDRNAGSQRPLKRVVGCGDDGSELHLITEGEHALDLCIADELCLAGSPTSAQRTSESVQRMLDWLGEIDEKIALQLAEDALDDSGDAADNAAADELTNSDESGVVSVSASGALTYWSSMLMLVMWLFRWSSIASVRQYRKR